MSPEAHLPQPQENQPVQKNPLMTRRRFGLVLGGALASIAGLEGNRTKAEGVEPSTTESVDTKLAPAEIPQGFKLFTSRNYDYSIVVPEAWQESELDFDGVKHDLLKGAQVSEDRYVGLEIYANQDGIQKSLSELMKSDVEYFKSTNVAADAREILVQDIYPGYMVTVPFEHVDSTQTYFSFNAGGKTYHFSTVIPNELASELDAVRNTLNTFQPPSRTNRSL